MRPAVVICVALLGGCGDREAAQLEKVKNAVCACKTASCADAAMNDLPKGEIKSTHKAQRFAREMQDCYSKLLESERPSTDPDAPATSPETSGSASARTP